MEKDDDIVRQVGAFKSNTDTLMLEGFKAETLIRMMNDCSDKCHL